MNREKIWLYQILRLAFLLVLITTVVQSEEPKSDQQQQQEIEVVESQNNTRGKISETISGVQVVPGIPPCNKDSETEFQYVINGTISPDGSQIGSNSSKILCTPKIPGAGSHYKIEVVVPGDNLQLGEGPHWDSEKKVLFYVDIVGRKIGRYVPKTGENSLISLEGTPSFIVPVENQPGNFIISQNRSLVKISVNWGDGQNLNSASIRSLRVLHTVESNYPINRFNDAKCDQAGRLWAGTMCFPTGRRKRNSDDDNDDRTDGDVDPENYTGRLYSLAPNGKLLTKLQRLGISNGLEWSPDNSKFYLVDSATDTIYIFDYNLRAGQIRNRKVFRKFDAPNSLPDGMAMDANGNLWVAGKSEGLIWNIDGKTGQTIRTIDFRGRALEVTSCAFGGQLLDELYVTSARFKLTSEKLKEEPDAGAIFRVTNLGVRGARPGRSYSEFRNPSS